MQVDCRERENELLRPTKCGTYQEQQKQLFRIRDQVVSRYLQATAQRIHNPPTDLVQTEREAQKVLPRTNKPTIVVVLSKMIGIFMQERVHRFSVFTNL